MKRGVNNALKAELKALVAKEAQMLLKIQEVNRKNLFISSNDNLEKYSWCNRGFWIRNVSRSHRKAGSHGRRVDSMPRRRR